MDWRLLTVIVCLFGFFKELRPSEAYLTPYLTEEWKHLTVEQRIGFEQLRKTISCELFITQILIPFPHYGHVCDSSRRIAFHIPWLCHVFIGELDIVTKAYYN